MKRFDCLDPACVIQGPHILEASAGTGKTFAIEHVFVRLLLEGTLLEKILIVTFTRAATYELKERVLANVRKALLCLQGKITIPTWLYLKEHIHSEEKILILTSALQRFEMCQIFTIHGFCSRMLHEFSFELGSSELLQEEVHPTEKFRIALSSFQRFLEKGIPKEEIAPEQMSLLFQDFDTLQELCSGVLSVAPNLKKIPLHFQQLQKSWEEISLAIGPIRRAHLEEDFENLRLQYKGFQEEMRHEFSLLLDAIENPAYLGKLLLEKGEVFSFFSLENRKVKAKEPILHHPQFWSFFFPSLGEIVAKGSNVQEIFEALSHLWQKWETMHAKTVFQPDDLLVEMRQAIEKSGFREKIQAKYSSVIIDEFQDTDPLQWEIFEKVFLSIKTFYLVGDPKQSIYRFRKADVYTYLHAKKILRDENLYHLDTNFRSSSELISSLNALFSRKFLSLPKIQGALPYHPVSSGSSITSDLQDDKKALHWMLGGENGSYVDTFLPFTVAEIKRLGVFRDVAILVKDRYEMEKAAALLQDHGIPFVAKSHERLADTYFFQAVKDLMALLASPHNEVLQKIVEMGPWQIAHTDWALWQELVLQEGLSIFFSRFCKHFNLDLAHVLDELFAWEKRDGFSFSGLERFFQESEQLEFDAIARRRMGNEDAVQIMTLHKSKGLEFDVVFALALASNAKVEEEEEEELNAEKLRQLYVAMTRAKKRVYVPVNGKKGTSLDLLKGCIEKEEGPFLPYLQKLSEQFSMSMEEIPTPFPLEPSGCVKMALGSIEPSILQMQWEPNFIESFTSLAMGEVLIQDKIDIDPKELPLGKETGTIVHAVFEAFFQRNKGEKLEVIVEDVLQYTPLAPWKEKVLEMVQKTLQTPLQDGENTFCLQDLERKDVYPEMEFLYLREGAWVKGFIDLVFVYEEKLYIVDWKTNLLNTLSISQVMQAHDYFLQAALYKEALMRHFTREVRGSFYFFVREGAYLLV